MRRWCAINRVASEVSISQRNACTADMNQASQWSFAAQQCWQSCWCTLKKITYCETQWQQLMHHLTLSVEDWATLAGCSAYKGTYVVKSGDTLQNIAATCNVNPYTALQTANGIRNGDRLDVGNRICIPADCSLATSTTSSPSPSGFLLELGLLGMRSD